MAINFEKLYLIFFTLICIPILGIFWQPLVLGIIMAVCIYPAVKQLKRFLNLKSIWALLIVNIIIGLLLLGGITWIVNVLTDQVNTIMDGLKNYDIKNIKSWPYIGNYVYPYISKLNVGTLVQKYAGYSFSKSLSIGSNITFFLIGFFIFAVWTNVLIRNRKKYLTNYIDPLCIKYPSFKKLVDTAQNTIYQVTVTLLTNALVTAVVMSIVYLSLGLKFVAFLSFLTFTAAMIPTAVIIVFILLGLITFMTLGAVKGIILLAIGLALNFFVDQFLQPTLLKKFGANLSFVMSLIGILGGIEYFGVIGIIIGPIMLSISVESLHTLIEVLMKNTNKDTVEDVPSKELKKAENKL